jgi:hypothetical protein
VDFDDDGIQDMISGSYDPGEFYLFRGEGLGVYSARETLKDKGNKSVLTYPDQKDPVESFGSWIATADWENDGDLDLILGGYGGELFVRINEGTRDKPEFALTNIPIEIENQAVQIPGDHATPVVVDWDGDGKWDLLSGSGNGGVYWLQNTGTMQSPQFAEIQTLIPAHQGLGYEEFLSDDSQAKPGIRSQISVVDYNHDGKLDLLLGDFCTNIYPRDDLTDDQRKELQHLIVEADKLALLNKQKYDEFIASYRADFPKEDGYGEEAQQAWKERYDAFRNSDQAKAALLEGEKLLRQRDKYLKPQDKNLVGDEISQCHGYVWLYLRK